MPDSSIERAVMLAKVRPRHACNLLAIVQQSALRDRSFIAARYADFAINFDETLCFLEEVGWLRSRGREIEPADDAVGQIVAAEGPQRSLRFAEGVLRTNGPYQRIFARYLAQFQRIDGQLIHQPNAEERLNEATVRDFFMDVGGVTHRQEGDFFVLEPSFAHCVLWARNALGPDARQLARQGEERRSLGYQAELVVLDWERARLGAAYHGRVQHVAAEYPASCFDIQSCTVDGEESHPRFIEVKAVALGSLEFHWSRAEIEAAEILGDRYFLYLVPVVGPSAFDTSRMEIVPDAYAEVYRNPFNWSTAIADTVCRKRASFAS